ncbi:PAQR family membrane homeostasis protein TrhA [Echinimonas agarilytica]|uniref:Hemolysin III family protein n=1 Tax=Echinimonas agarilytica TaxID=1215918 RepID=A0AA42B8T3_9GAMM|nr:hemolysin III family protein [Echinimonas agarilytica]MCM2681385.1 hemolysin III family protein [Echinimonas agarilytica]
MPSIPAYSPAEEWANSLTHALGLILSVVALVMMVVVSVELQDTWRVVATSVYGGSLILLFLASVAYHAVPWTKLKTRLKLFDHCAIYLLIAGSYTPFLLISMRDTLGWWLFGIVWSMAALGITLKIGWGNRFKILRVASYLVMGWLIVVAIKPLTDAIGQAGLIWLAAGGACYSVGVIFYLRKSLSYAHSIWHLFVVAGAMCHFFAVWFHVLPMS